MCDPLSAFATGLGAVNYLGGQAAAKAAHSHQKGLALANYEILQDKQEKVNDAYAIQQSERFTQGMLERAQIATIAGESGALGMSTERLLQDSFMQEGRDISSLESYRKNEIKNISDQQTEGKLISQAKIQQAYSSAPTLVETGLQIGSDIYTGKARAKNRSRMGSETL